MPRPFKVRRVCSLPDSNRFGPTNRNSNGQIFMTVDEYETIRLIDLEKYNQEECAEQMGVARTTVQSIYNVARIKIADALVNGKALTIDGGKYELCEGLGDGCGRGCRNRHGNNR